MRDLELLEKLVNDIEQPVQFIFAGKAHPADDHGKTILQRIVTMSQEPRFKGKVVFLEDYDINLGRHLVQGVDVWLNNPRRPLEASGTSGQKAVLNGALNCSVLDGWWAEAYDGRNGFAIGKGSSHVSDEITDTRDGESLYDVIENQVIPTFYRRDVDGLPRDWIRMMMNSIAGLAWRFSSDRMIMDYTQACYNVAAGGVSCDMPPR